MLKFIVVFLALLVAVPALALEKEVERDLNIAAMMLTYRDLCGKPDWTGDQYRKYFYKRINSGEIGDSTALEYVIDRSAILGLSIEKEGREKFFCSYVSENISNLDDSVIDSGDRNQKTFSENLLGRKFSLMIEMVILGFVGLIIGLVIGFPIKLISGKSFLTESWWMLGWMIGFPILVRALVQAGYLG